MNIDVMYSSKEEKWQTPNYLFNELDKEFNFTLDPCCQTDSAKCEKYYTPKENGLKQSWENEVVFVNPPYGRELKKWVKKCYKESKHATIVMLIPARTDTSYFHDYIYHTADIRFIRGRIKFIDPVTKEQSSSSAPFPSMICIYKNN